MGTCYSCNSRHSTPQQRTHHRVGPLDNKPLPRSACSSELGFQQSPCCGCPSENTAPTCEFVAQPASSSGYVTGKSPLDTSASRFSDSTWTSENHPDFPGPQRSSGTSDSGNKGDQRGTASGDHRPTHECPSGKGGQPATRGNGCIPANSGNKMSCPVKKSLFDTPQLPSQSLKCDLNLNSRPRLTSDYAQASQHAVLHSQPQSYATRRGILSYRRLEPMFRKVEVSHTVTKTTTATDRRTFVTGSSDAATADCNANTAGSDVNANQTLPAPVPQLESDNVGRDAVAEPANSDLANKLPASQSTTDTNTQRYFFHPTSVQNDKEVISSVLEFLKSPTTAGVSGHQTTKGSATDTPGTENDGKAKLGGPIRAVRPTTLENLKPCTPKIPVKCPRLAETSTTVDTSCRRSQEKSAVSPRTTRSAVDNGRQGVQGPPERQMSPLRIIERSGSPQRSSYRQQEHAHYRSTTHETSRPAVEHDRQTGQVTASAAGAAAWSPVKTERFFSRYLHLQRQPAQGPSSPEKQIRKKSRSPEAHPRKIFSDPHSANRSPAKTPARSPISHQSSGSLNSDILEKVEGLIDDDFVDQPSLIASSKNSLDSETSRCSVNLQLQSLGMGMNRGMLMYHELARIKEQLLILRTTLEHCIVDEADQVDDSGRPERSPLPVSSNENVVTSKLASSSGAADQLAVNECTDLRRQLVLLGEELKGRDATIRKLQQELASRRTPLMLSENSLLNRVVKNVAVQTNS